MELEDDIEATESVAFGDDKEQGSEDEVDNNKASILQYIVACEFDYLMQSEVLELQFVIETVWTSFRSSMPYTRTLSYTVARDRWVRDSLSTLVSEFIIRRLFNTT